MIDAEVEQSVRWARGFESWSLFINYFDQHRRRSNEASLGGNYGRLLDELRSKSFAMSPVCC